MPKSERESQKPATEDEVVILANEKDIARLGEQVASAVTQPGFREDALPAFLSFIHETYSRSGPAAVAIMERRERYARANLEILLLWSSPVDPLNEQQEDEIEDIGERHDQLVQALPANLESSLKVIDPRRYRTAQAFRTSLTSRCEAVGSERLIAFTQFRR